MLSNFRKEVASIDAIDQSISFVDKQFVSRCLALLTFLAEPVCACCRRAALEHDRVSPVSGKDRRACVMSDFGMPRVLFVLLVGALFVAVTGRRGVTQHPLILDAELEGDNFDEHKAKRGSIAFSLEDVYRRNFQADYFNGSWFSDTEILYADKTTGNIQILDARTLKRKVLFNFSDLADYHTLSYFSVSPSQLYLLIGYDALKGYRFSTVRRYTVYDATQKSYRNLAEGHHIQHILWAPDEDSLAYVYKNDIYYYTMSDHEGKPHRVTCNGKPGLIFNGVPDWVYEEEVLHTNSALWFSKDGTRLAFATFNDTSVKDMSYYYYGNPGSLKNQYTEQIKVKYPKAGSPNPLVSLSVADLSDPECRTKSLPAPIESVGTDHILFTVSWLDEETVAATWTNRVQNESMLVLYDCTSGRVSKVLHQMETEGWLQPYSPIYHAGYMLILKLQESGTPAGRFLHLTRYKYDNESAILSEETDLTPGARDVQEVYGVRNADGRIYYLATTPGKPERKSLYSVNIDGDPEPICISCKLLTPEGNNCSYASALFSRQKSYYILGCYGPDPIILGLNDARDKQILLWENNDRLRRKLVNMSRPLIKDLWVHTHGYDAKVRLFLPPDFSENKSYPMIVEVYGGPNTVKVIDAAAYGLEMYMSTNRSIIYAWIDGRGSGYKGSKMLFEAYRRLGTVEVKDQIAVTRRLQNEYPWIDARRTGIWGWSYGGFCSSMILATDASKIFKCGISVAPVTSWIYYDSVYTERVMGLPTVHDNLAGYNRSDVTKRVEGIRGKKFMLIHGTGDDNVHYQQSMALAKALEAADILFDQVTYPDEAHALSHVSPHLYHTMDKFWNDCFR